MTTERTIVHLLRHGEVYNPQRVLYGRLPGYSLSDRGQKMALAVTGWLAGRDLTYLVASPLERAQETAGPVAAQFGLPIDTDDRLLEADNQFEGKQFGVGDGALRHPRVWWTIRNPFRPSWGEPYAQIADRMLEAMRAARRAAQGHEALCVSHQLPIWTVRQRVEGRRLWHDPRRRQCALASVTSFHFEGDEVVGIEYAEPAAHLVAGSPVAGDKGA